MLAQFGRIPLVLISILGLLACAHPGDYQEPDLPLDQVATLSLYKLETIGPFLVHDVWVLGIDGMGKGPGTEKTLTPGRHEVYVSYRREFIIGGTDYYPAEFLIDVDAGHSYQIRAGKEDDAIRIWVEDIETAEVAGMASIVEERTD